MSIGTHTTCIYTIHVCCEYVSTTCALHSSMCLYVICVHLLLWPLDAGYIFFYIKICIPMHKFLCMYVFL